MYANLRSYRCYLPDCARLTPLWTPSKMATDWCTENCNHGNQLFGNSSDGGGGRRYWPVGIYSQINTHFWASLWCLTGTEIERMGKSLLVQSACIRFNPSPSSPSLFFRQDPSRQNHPLLLLFSVLVFVLDDFCLLLVSSREG